MAWTAPRTWVAGEVLTAALMNTHLRDNLVYLKSGPPSFDAGVQIPGTNVLEMGAGVGGKEGNAGKIGYGYAISTELAIYGVGTAAGARVARVYDFLEVQTLPIARVRHSVSQTVANNATTALAFDTVVYNVNGMWGSGTNTKLIAQRAGYYLFGGSAEWTVTSATGYRALFLIINATTVFGSVAFPAVSTADPFRQHVAAPYFLNAGDYVTLSAYQNSGGSLSISSASDYSPSFWAVKQT